jgi:hypothetical protein
MPLVALALVLILPFVLLALVPFSLVLRYRASTARRQARGWIAAINVVAFGISAALFLAVAAVTSLWVPRAFTYTLAGLAGGCALGVLGLWLSRWEATAHALHYTPSRFLVLTIMLVVASRMAFGLWRAWHAWHTAMDKASWLAASGAAGSLAAGAVVLGYFLAYHAGVWRRLRQHGRTALPTRPRRS